MTNETTASQPKSIGDDAQFYAWLDRIGDCGNREQFKQVSAAFIAYIHEYFRAPAAQASATIQAAPEDRLDIDAILAIAAELDQEANNYEGGFADTVSGCAEELERLCAATIQEPVMVAEPVGDGLPPEVQKLFDQLRPEIDYWCTHRRESILAALDAIEFRFKVSQARTVRLESAAPMVADPAGVAWDYATMGIPNEEVTDIWRAAGHSGTVPFSFANRIQERMQGSLAATVKAVPSEALDLMKEARELAPILRGMCEGGADRGDDIYAADYQASDGDVFVIRAAELLDDFAAPLADKTTNTGEKA